MHDVIMGSKNRTELDLSATATVRYSEAAENASIKKNSPAAQALHDESPPPDNLDSNLLKQFDDSTLDELAARRNDPWHPDNMAICKGNAAGCCLHPFGPPATMNFDSALPLLQCSSGGDSCMIANVTPASTVAIPGLGSSSTEEDLPLVVQGRSLGADFSASRGRPCVGRTSD